MSKLDVDALKTEEDAIDQRVQTPKPQSSYSYINSLLKNALLELIRSEVDKSLAKRLEKTQEVTFKGEPGVSVEFPDIQRIRGIVKILNEVKAEVSNLPDVQKIAGKVTAEVRFPDLQKIEGKVKTDVPIVEVNGVKVIPIAVFDGKRLVSPFQQVQTQIVGGGRGASSAAELREVAALLDNMTYDELENLYVNLNVALAGENLAQDVTGVLSRYAVNSIYSGIAFTNYGANASASVTTVPTMIKAIHAQNENAAIRYLQIFNLTAAPTDDTSVPLFSFAIPAGTAAAPGTCSIGEEFFGKGGYYLSAGLSWGISVDPDVYDETGITAGEHQVNGIRV